MTTVFVATTADEVRSLFPWADALATSRSDELMLLLPIRRKGETRLVSVASTPDPDESDLLTAAREGLDARRSDEDNTQAGEQHPSIRLLPGEAWQLAVADRLTELKPSLVVVPAPTI